MTAFKSMLELIGNTPMVELTRLDTGRCRLFVKLENNNPGGSIKDRIAVSMIEGAEKSGKLKPGGTIVEATSGNTGIGLAFVGAHKGYKVIIVIPDKMSAEKIYHLRALGAEVLVTRSDVPPGHPNTTRTWPSASRRRPQAPTTSTSTEIPTIGAPMSSTPAPRSGSRWTTILTPSSPA